jgi:hypothetical protein
MMLHGELPRILYGNGSTNQKADLRGPLMIVDRAAFRRE